MFNNSIYILLLYAYLMLFNLTFNLNKYFFELTDEK